MHESHDAPADSATAVSGYDPDAPRKPFNARGSFVSRCPECRLPKLNCLCPYRVAAESRVRFWLLTHPIEHYKPTNTGRLISHILPETEVFTWYRTEPDPRLLALLEDDRFAPFVVFPDDQADYAERVVGPEAVDEALADSRTPVFILLDGTWRQARRIFRRSEYLASLPVLPLKTSRLTRYRLRKAASSEHLCTAEVAAELLRISGDAEASAILDDYFEVFNENYASSRRDRPVEAPSGAMQRLLERRGDADGASDSNRT
ncbi:tRNA-uridine aminocarboxypropyltransferase [Chromohalobacter japonicus]|uniref:tRNA-uridine aminocarboxypropyltransferase n=1 Tax=Chromohalobacter japonicus TaxID=223900 RepID=UPI001FF4E563|nr:DTW domain-containing protein [Chromohalobacter japonicus]MCK0753538.1 DTW domain-containing protein [Chromohalobacter japonicus]